jgi:hypothetical protein
MTILVTKFMFRSVLAVGLILATISGSAAQFCGPGLPISKNCSCPWGTHLGGFANKTQLGTVGCGSPCPMCIQDDPPRPQRQPSGALPDIADKPRSEGRTVDEKREAARNFRTQRGLSYVERRDKSFSSETPAACADTCMESPTCGRATFWLKSSSCFLFTRGARTEDWGYKDNNAISFSFE